MGEYFGDPANQNQEEKKGKGSAKDCRDAPMHIITGIV